MPITGGFVTRTFIGPDAMKQARLADCAEMLRDLLGECADELESELKARYHGYDHPAMTMRFERDMDIVNRARAAIAKATGA